MVAAVAEALQVLLSWNPTWEPPYFMFDFSEIELNAVQSVFPHTTIYLVNFIVNKHGLDGLEVVCLYIYACRQ